MTGRQSVVLFSGGQDSTTCLAWAIDMYGKDNIFPVSFWYNQKHQVELSCAHAIAEGMGVRTPFVLPVEALKTLGGAALTNSNIEVEMKASAESDNQFAAEHGLPSTFVPGRNMLFLTLAAAYGAQNGIYNLVAGMCEADAAGYPDCRQEFVHRAQQALSAALDDVVTIEAPLLKLNKAKTFALAEELGVLNIIVDMTHTCYHGDRSKKYAWGHGCGECPACNERANGWAEFQEMTSARI